MRTYKNLYPQITSWENIYLAYRQARKGKRRAAPAASFEFHEEEYLLDLQQELIAGRYQPGAYHSFYIHEPKRRLISAAPFRDRVVHHALCRIIEPLFERSFIFDSYANRVGKGTHRALDRAQRYARRYRYVLQCDVEQFFPAIDHHILKETLGRRLRDRETMGLIETIIDSGTGVLTEAYEMRWFPGDNLLAGARPRGLPIGNLTSQFWANCYLDPLDHFVKRTLRCRAYVRYVDDLLLFADDKETLWGWLHELVEQFAKRRLTLHPGAHPRPVTEGVPFLGFVVFPTHRRLKRRKVDYARRHLRRRYRQYLQGEIAFADFDASIQGWINHVRYGDTWGLRENILKEFVLLPSRAAALQGEIRSVHLGDPSLRSG